jgi:hypothetical protein
MACATPFDPTENLRRWRAFEELEAKITELWGHLNAATYRFLTLVAELDRGQAYERHGLVNTAQWLNWQCGIGPVAAREKVRVARALGQLPEISAAFANGEISCSKVRAMTRVATPANESVLVHIARYGTAAHVEKLVRKYHWTQRRDARRLEQQLHAQRHVTYFFDVNGELILNARLPPEIGAVVRKALETAVEALREPSEPADSHGFVSAETDTHESPTAGARRADALRHIADTFLAQRGEIPARARAPIGTKSSCISTKPFCPRLVRRPTTSRIAASSTTARPSRSTRPVGSRATRPSSASSKTRTASRSTSAASRAVFRRRWVARCARATAAAAIPAAIARASRTGTT